MTSPAAVYTLVDLGPRGGDELIKALEAGEEDLQGTCRLAPEYNFAGRPLRAVYDYHLEHVAPLGSLHPTLFIVAHHPDYKDERVLLVNLDVALDCRVDVCRIPVDQAASAAINAAIGNSDWEEIKEGAEDDEDDEEEELAAGEGNKNPDSTERQGLPVFAAYDIADANLSEVHGRLEPDWAKKAPAEQRCSTVCTYEGPDAWKEMIEMHPWSCYRAEGEFHPQLFICADRKDVDSEGVCLVKMDWDGNIDRDPDELIEIGSQATVHTRRCPVDQAISTLTSIATGESAWEDS